MTKYFVTMVVFVLGENHFRKCFFGNEAVWLVRKILFSGNWNSLTEKKKPLTTEIILHFYFPFKVFPENERERESARARSRSPVCADRDLAGKHSSRRWSRSREDRNRQRDLTFNRDLAKKARSSDSVQCRRWWFFPRLWLVFFWICVFLLLFQTPENFFRKIF